MRGCLLECMHVHMYSMYVYNYVCVIDTHLLCRPSDSCNTEIYIHASVCVLEICIIDAQQTDTQKGMYVHTYVKNRKLQYITYMYYVQCIRVCLRRIERERERERELTVWSFSKSS